MKDQTWREKAACRTHPHKAIWFPSLSGNSRDAAEAKAICRDCEVRIACLDYALTANQQWGIWGGLSEEERKRIRHRPKGA